MADSRRARPDIFGAASHHWRQGTSVANTETPPAWSPEQSLSPDYPYVLSEYMKDVSRWMVATKVSSERQGPLIALAVGGAARTVADELPDDLLVRGAVADLGDGLGNVHRHGVTLLFHALMRKFPENQEARMLRAGLDFFAFTPRAGETTQLIFLRFDTMLDKANQLANLNISYPFRARMVLALPRLPPRKWAEHLKEMGHRFPNTADEYRRMQEGIVREKTLETEVGTLGGPGRSNHQAHFVGLGCVDADALPLYLCLGDPAAKPEGTTQTTFPTQRATDSHHTAAAYLQLEDRCASDSEASDDEMWRKENDEDPYNAERLSLELSTAKADPMYLAELWWAKRVATRRYRAAKGRFGPNKRHGVNKVAKRFTRRGPANRFGKPSKGFFIEDIFITLEDVPDETLAVFFAGGRSKFSGGGKDQRCFNCGKEGHFANVCKEAQKCFGCNGTGHKTADCPHSQGRSKAMVMWGSNASPAPPNQEHWLVMGTRLKSVEETPTSTFSGVVLEDVTNTTDQVTTGQVGQVGEVGEVGLQGEVLQRHGQFLE